MNMINTVYSSSQHGLLLLNSYCHFDFRTDSSGRKSKFIENEIQIPESRSEQNFARGTASRAKVAREILSSLIGYFQHEKFELKYDW